ncbi:copper homeostasis protein CutC [Escherichia coli]|nr:copper homeostasis protein CutC [Escherichia coli]
MRSPKRGGLNAVVGCTEIRAPAGDDPCASDNSPTRCDFCYSDGEFAAILEDVRTVRELGFPGLVTGGSRC